MGNKTIWAGRRRAAQVNANGAQSTVAKSDDAISAIFTSTAENILRFVQMFLQSILLGFLALFQSRSAQRLDSLIKEKKIANPSAMAFFGAVVTAAIIDYKAVLLAMIKPELEKLGNSTDVPELSTGGGLWVSAALAVSMFLLFATIGIICANFMEARFGAKRLADAPGNTSHRISLPVGFAAWAMYMIAFCWPLDVMASRFDGVFNHLSISDVFTYLPIHPNGYMLKNSMLAAIVIVPGLRLAGSIGYSGRDRGGKIYQGILAIAIRVMGAEVATAIMAVLAMEPLQLVDKMVFQHEQLLRLTIDKAPFITNATMYCSTMTVGNGTGVECSAILQNLEANPFAILNATPLALDNITKSEKLDAMELDKMIVKETFSGGLPQQLRKDAVITYKVDFTSVSDFCKLVRVGASEQGRLRLGYSVKGLDYYDANGYWENRPTFDKAVVWNFAGNTMQNNFRCPAQNKGK